MKRFIQISATALSIVLSAGLLAGCSGTAQPPEIQPASVDAGNTPTTDDNLSDTEANTVTDTGKTINIGATPSPHAEILEAVAEVLKESGYTLNIIEFNDYIQPNLALDSDQLDANFFQHQPYLDEFNQENGTNLVPVANVHYEPFGIYGGKASSINDLQDGAQIGVPNDTTNEARALLLLEAQGLLTIRPDAGLEATKNDIIDNPKNLNVIEAEAASLPRSLQDLDLAVINGNYALQAGLNAAVDALATEDSQSLAAATYANVIAVKSGNENREDIQALVQAILSDTVKEFINNSYGGAVVPIF